MEVQSDPLKTPLSPGMTSDTVVGQTDKNRLPLRIKLIYAVGEIGNSIKSYAFGLFLLFYYTTVLGLPGTLVGATTAISLVWDALIDPFIGHLSDRVQSRFGRRHPFMVLGAICMGVCFALVFYPPTGLSTGQLFAWLLVSNILLRTTNSIFIIPYHALGAELSDDYYERTSVTGARAAMALFGTLIAAALSFAVFFRETTPGVDPKFDMAGYRTMGLVYGIAISAAGLVAAFGTRAYATARQAQTRSETGLLDAVKFGFWESLRLTLRSRSFIILTISTSLFFLASVINATVAVHYLTYYAQITDSRSLSLFQLSFYVGGLVGVVIWLRTVHRLAKHHLFIGATLMLAVLMLSAFWLFGQDSLFGTGSLLPLIIGNAIGGFFGSAIWVVPASMIADVTDEDAIRTGYRREGAFFGVNSFFVQEAGGLAVLFSGLLLDHFALLVPGQVDQSAQTVQRLGAVYGLLPAVLLCVSALLMSGYALTPDKVRDLQSKLLLGRNSSHV